MRQFKVNDNIVNPLLSFSPMLPSIIGSTVHCSREQTKVCSIRVSQLIPPVDAVADSDKLAF